MLFLIEPPSDAGGAGRPRLPLPADSAARLELALLANDDTTRAAELATAFAGAAIAEWAIGVASHRSGRPVASLEDAMLWWTAHLEAELATWLLADDAGGSSESPAAIEQRLPALAAKLAAFQTQLANFNARLEFEKLESLKELAYGASHEINNPLANIAARAQTLVAAEADPERRRKLLAIHRQALRAHEMISDLMLFARPPKLTLAPCDLPRLVERVLEAHRGVAADREIELASQHGEDVLPLIPADETQLAVAFDAIVMNALEAVGCGGRVEVMVGRATVEGFLEIAVQDDGPGVSKEVRRHMFDPFFSGREAGRGLGFGLSKCWRIVTDHGGRVVVHRPAGRGARISILLPAM